MTLNKTYLNTTTPPFAQPAGTGAVVDGDLFMTSGSVVTRVTVVPPTFAYNVAVGDVAITTLGGTGTAPTAGQIFYGELVLPWSKTCTGLAVANGTVVGTDNLIVAVWDDTGVLLRTSLLTGTLAAGASTYQQIPFVALPAGGPATVSLQPGRYLVGVQSNGTTATQRRVTNVPYGVSGVQAGVFGTIPAIASVSTTFTTAQAPFAYLY